MLTFTAVMDARVCVWEETMFLLARYSVAAAVFLSASAMGWALLNRRLAPLVGPLWEVHCTPPPSGECFLRREEEARRLVLEEALAGRWGIRRNSLGRRL
jgi:hypothetical protein